MKYFISIISPIRNEEKYIAKCLTSLLNQNFDKEKYEILIIDGMSTDKTRDKIKEFQKQFKIIKLFENRNLTAPYALNIGLKNAKGNVIIRIDGHVFVEKDYLFKCIKYLESTKAECVGGVIESINENFIGKAIALAMSSPFGVGNARFRTSGEEGYVDCLAFGAYLRDVFDRIGYFDEELVRCQDDEFNYRLRKFGGKIFLTPQIKAYYYPRSNLNKLWRQYFQYGFWKIRVLQKHFKMMQIRQFVPPAFVLSLILGLSMGLLYKNIIWLFFLIIINYLSASLFVSFRLTRNKNYKFFFILPPIFAILHMSYGLGFLLGLIRFLPNWIKIKNINM